MRLGMGTYSISARGHVGTVTRGHALAREGMLAS